MLIKLLFDKKLNRPACTILQGVVRNTDRRAATHALSLFDTDKWLTRPTPDMVCMSGTAEQWEKKAKEVNSERRAIK